MIESQPRERTCDRGEITHRPTQPATVEIGSPVLELGNGQIITFNLFLQQLYDFQLLPQLMEEIAIDDILDRAALSSGFDLNYSSIEFAELYAQIAKSQSDQGMNSAQLMAITERELKLQKFKQQRWGDRVEDYFKTQQRRLDRVVLSILKVVDPLVARELFFRLQTKEQSFAEIALKYSQDIYRQQAGMVGPILLRDLAPQIGRIVLKLQPGELSSPFPIGKYHGLILLDKLEPAQLDDQMHKFMIDELFSIWIKSEISKKTHSNIYFLNGNLATSIPPKYLLSHFRKSKLLVPYLRQTIISQAIKKWQQSAEYQLLFTNTSLVDLETESLNQIRDFPPEMLSERTRKISLLQHYKQSRWGHLVGTRFLKCKSQLDRVLFSAIQVSDRFLAEELYCRIHDQGQSFTKLATIYSQRPAAKLGGAVGPISLAELHPQIYHHTIGLKPKQLSPIFKLDEHYTFLRLECWLPAEFNHQIQSQLLNDFFEEWLEQEIADLIRV